MKHAEIRQQSQLAFMDSQQDIVVGDINNFPLSIEELKAIDRNANTVSQYIGGGLTSEIFKLQVNGQFYTLKKKRERCLVSNIDGQTSFLNEVQRRADFALAKRNNPDGLESIIDTIYASLKDEIILSPWIEGDEVQGYSEALFENLFSTLFNMEKSGIFEYDLCNGNILVRPSDKVKFFDFGYAYQFNPLTEFNPDGKERPDLHMAERFETRTFMQHLCDIEQVIDKPRALDLYRIEKEILLKYYKQKRSWLLDNSADTKVVEQVSHYIKLWQRALMSAESLEKLYSLDQFRSFLLDLEDDVSGKSCNSDTITKGEKVVKALEHNYQFLKENDAFLAEDKVLNQQAMLDKYTYYLTLSKKHQLEDLSAFNEWKIRRMHTIKAFYSQNSV